MLRHIWKSQKKTLVLEMHNLHNGCTADFTAELKDRAFRLNVNIRVQKRSMACNAGETLW